MKPKAKRSTIIPLALLAYLAVMSVLAYPDLKAGRNTPAYYCSVIIVTLAIIIALHFFLKKREKLRQEREADMAKAEREREKSQK